MKTNAFFNLQRMGWVLKRDLLTSLRPALIAFGGAFGLLLILNQLMVASNGPDVTENYHMIFYALTMYIGGFILTSRAFGELHRPLSRISFLNLPASVLEKFLSMLLLTSLGYGLLVWISYPIYMWVTTGLAEWWFGRSFRTFSMFDYHALLHLKLYLVIQSVFLLGAATFNRFALPKTLISLFIANMILSAVAFLFMRVVFFDFENFLEKGPPPPDKAFIEFVEGTLWNWVQNIFWILVAPFFWVVTYFKLKEREV